MSDLTHGFRIGQDKCEGCFSCMRVCPTQAIRVRDGKACLLPERCIDCGSCLQVCSTGTITATTRSFHEFGKFKYRVAIPSPVLYGQFPVGITPEEIVEGLHWMGFNEVWDYAVEIGLVQRALRHYVENWKGPYPLISSSCPVIVRLVQVSYPDMVDQLVCVELPRELAAREAKRKCCEELAIGRDEIAAIYITPCQAKSISILQPAEGATSEIDGSLGISDVYNTILDCARIRRDVERKSRATSLTRNAGMLRWYMGDGQGARLPRHRYISVTGLSNVISVFDDIEKGKLRNVEYLEAYSCWGGCAAGNLTVNNVYVTLSRLQSLMVGLPDMDPETEAEVERRYPTEEFSLKGPVKPRPVKGNVGDLKERVRIVKEAEAILGALPGFDCGLCGAPTCKALASDISVQDARDTDCVFVSGDRLDDLRKRYPRARK